MLLTFSAINLCALAAGLQIYSPAPSASSTSRASNGDSYFNFQDTSQLATNALLFIATTYSFLSQAQWSPRIRAIAGLTLVACNLALIGDQFRSMALNGGCDLGDIYNYAPSTIASSSNNGNSHRFLGDSTAQRVEPITTPIKRRCHIQMVVGIVSVLWGLLLLMELLLTNMHHKRDTVKKVYTYRAEDHEYFQEDQEEHPPMSGVVHYYHPDLSLDGSGRRVRNGPHSLELESLPAYEPRLAGPRPQIVDMANLGSVSQPARIHSRPARVPRESRMMRVLRESRTGVRPPSYTSQC